MLGVMTSLPDRHRLARIQRDIAEHGVHVAVADVDLPLLHTVGHAAVHTLPELMIVGAAEPLARTVLTELSAQMRAGWAAPTTPDRVVDVDGCAVRFRRRAPSRGDVELLPIAQRFTEVLWPGASIDIVEVVVAAPTAELSMAS